MLVFRFSACQRKPGHRRDAGKRFAAEAQACHALQVIERGNFAGGVARQREGQVFPGDTAAVVKDFQKFDSAMLQLHRNFTGARIQAVFQQFFKRRSRTVNYLAGGDLVDE